MTEYSDALREHLADYKTRRHPDLPDGIYRGNGRAYAHVLPEEKHRLNILPSFRDEFWSYFEANSRELALHTDFHHLNSSQAFAFNLFFPWMREDQTRQRLLSELGVRTGPLARWQFEHIPDPAERTAFDVFAEYEGGARLLVEVKLTEGYFGIAQADESHLRKREEVYLPRLTGKVRPEFLEQAHFLLNYQLFRNISHLDVTRGDQLVLLVPRSNTFTFSQAVGILETLLPEARAAVRVVPAETLIAGLSKTATEVGGPIAIHMADLSEKYAL